MKTKNGSDESTVEAFYNLISEQKRNGDPRQILKKAKDQEKFRLMCYGASLVAGVLLILWMTNNPLNYYGREDLIDVLGTMLLTFEGVMVILFVCYCVTCYNHEFIDNLHAAQPLQKLERDFRTAWRFRNFRCGTPESVAEHIDREARSMTKEILMYEQYRKNHSTPITKPEKKARAYLKVLISIASSLELMGTRYARPDNGLASSLKPLGDRRAEWLYTWLFRNPDFKV